MKHPKHCVILLISITYALLFSGVPAVYAATSKDDLQAIINNTVYYKPKFQDCPDGASAGASTASGGKTYLIGDSIAVGAQVEIGSALPPKGFTPVEINAVKSRSISEGGADTNGLTVLEKDKPKFADAKVVIVELGANSGIDAGKINKVMSIIKAGNSSAQVYWINIGADNSKRGGNGPLDADTWNTALQQNTSAGYTVIDWASRVKQHLDYIVDDSYGVHLTGPGKVAFAGTIVASLGAPAADNSSGASDTSNCACQVGTLLAGNDNPEKIWNFLVGKGLTAIQTAGFLGNMQAESHFEPRLVEYGYLNSRGETSKAGQPSSLDDNVPPDTGPRGQPGYGIVQWTGGRKQPLRDKSASTGLKASDLGLQLERLWEELQGPYKNNVYEPLTKSTTLDEATYLVLTKFEVPSNIEATKPVRLSFARDILNRYGSGGGGASANLSGGGGAGCGASSSVVAGNIAQTAVNLSWKDGPHGTIATPEYREAASKVYPGADDTKLTNCSAFVATVMISSGADPNFPKGCSKDQGDYARAHPEKYDIDEAVTDESELQPGDILVVGACDKSGHILIYVGPQQDGKFNIASASQESRMPNLGKMVKFTEARGTYARIRLKG